MLRISEHFQYYKHEEEHLTVLKSVSDGLFIPHFDKSVSNIVFGGNEENICLKLNVSEEKARIETSYYIGLDRIQPWNMPVYVEPKVNNNHHKLNHLSMLLEALTEPKNLEHLDGLMEIRFDDEWIEVDGKDSIELTPFLIAQFLIVVKAIVRKGLKKDYYRVRENLTTRVKGKIIVGQQIRQNLMRHDYTKTVCDYQDYGMNTEANQFLKYVLEFIQIKMATNNASLEVFTEMLRFNLGSFHQVAHKRFYSFDKRELNPLYKEYNIAIQLGNQLLKLLEHNLAKSNSVHQKYPPHWIDMSKLFELYVFKKLKERFTRDSEVKYHSKFNRQELDFLIQSGDFKAIVDAKYKPRYKSGNPSMSDARQLSGYARLNSVYKELNIKSKEVIDVYIIYPEELKCQIEALKNEEDIFEDTTSESVLMKGKPRISTTYKNIFMQEVELPIA